MSSDLREFFDSSLLHDATKFAEVIKRAKLVEADYRGVYGNGTGARTKVIALPALTADIVGKRPFVLVYHTNDRVILEIIPDRASAQREVPAPATEAESELATESAQG